METNAMSKRCPKCSGVYAELDNYCTKCGIALEKSRNVCSGNKTAMCAKRVYADDDVYCAFCGSLTTYAAEREAMRERIKGSFGGEGR
jgi:hypothetical protein